jgi:(2Fe-2S) ferredoxin
MVKLTSSSACCAAAAALLLASSSSVAGVLVNAFVSTTPAATSSHVVLNAKVIRVCQSPGCRDDGAQSTLDCLTALAAPGCQVMKGGCVSLCGSGPVVEILPDGEDNVMTISSVKRKKVKGDVLLSLLDVLSDKDTDISSSMRQRLIMGYEQSLEAKAAYEAKDYQSAVQLYEEAIQIGRNPAMALEEARSSLGNNHDSIKGINWLVDSFRNSCRARLALKDIDGARRDAFAATVFSQNMDADSHMCLAEVCRASSDTLGELQATKAAIEQYQRLEDEYSKPLPGKDAVARAEAAKIKNNASTLKRELGFRLVKLERELKASS